MYRDNRILAVVPARAGSKGVPNKNLRKVGDLSLIGHAGVCLQSLPWIDYKIISTDSLEYGKEGERYNIDMPFLRPAELSQDQSDSLSVMQHVISEIERSKKCLIDIALIIEPTCPLRTPADIEGTLALLLEKDCDSVVSVSPCDPKFHPLKIFSMDDDRLKFYESQGASVTARQGLKAHFYRNGACYAIRRDVIMEKSKLITENSCGFLIKRPLINIDYEIEIEIADFLYHKSRSDLSSIDKQHQSR